MKFEETGRTEYPHKLTFEGREIDIVSAAFKEHIYNLAKKGNTGSISDYDVTVAEWERLSDDSTHSVLTRNYENVAEILDDFHTNTDDALVELPEITGSAPYVNEDIPERHRLGREALKLAQTIRETATAPLTDEDMEAGIRSLLSGN